MKVFPNVREDPTKEVAETDFLRMGGYEWVPPTVTEQFSLFRWSL